MDERAYGALLDALYSAPLAPDRWSEVLERLCRILDGDSGWMAKLDTSGGGSGALWQIEPSMQDRYFEHFETLDPFRERSKRDRRPIGVVGDGFYLDKHDLVRSEFYNDFLRPLDTHSILMFKVFDDGHVTRSIHINRPERRGGYERSETDLAATLLSHLERAALLAHNIEEAGIRADCVTETFEQTSAAILLLDARGYVRYVSRPAEALLAAGFGLRLRNGRLDANQAAVQSKLERLIGDAASRDKQVRKGGSLMVVSPARRLPLAVTVAPLDRETMLPMPAHPRVLVSIVDPNQTASLSHQTVTDMFGLTRAETRLALMLMDGATPRESAERLGVTFNTVRNQMKAIFAKVDVNRQSELIALMTRVAAAKTHSTTD